jgi:hypothetical protein
LIERRELDGLGSRRKTAEGLAQRPRIGVLAAEGAENKDIFLRIGAARHGGRRRFAEFRVAGVLDEPRPGAPRQIGDDEVAEIIRQTLETTPKEATHWSLRSMAKAAGLAPATIHRIWKVFNLPPHRAEMFKLSADPLFVEKVRDIVGLYLSPPQRALALCVDEKVGSKPSTDLSRFSSCGQAKSSGARTITRATERSACSPLSTPPPARSSGAAIPVIADASSRASCARSSATSRAVPTSTSSWTTTRPTRPSRSESGSARARPRWHVHFTPTTSSWINQVERFLADIIEKQIRRGVHCSTAELETAIRACLDADPKPFRWTKSADGILAAVKRFGLKIREITAAQTEIARNSESGH